MKRQIKLSLHFALIFISIQPVLQAQVGVNILTPNPSAAMHIESPSGTYKGLLTPTMTSVNRTNIIAPVDGLIVYDKNHAMHYYYNGQLNAWVSMSPLTLSASGSATNPAGYITTPSTTAVFSVGINKQIPTQALDVVGNATVSGNILSGGNAAVAGNFTVSGSLAVYGFASNALVPIGGIIMWSGLTVPTGWALCDGATYGSLTAPDLRGKFIVGFDNTSPTTPAVATTNGTSVNYGAIGNRGGENGHALINPELPKHQHSLQTSIDGCSSAVSTTTLQDAITGFSNSGLLQNGNGLKLENDIPNVIGHNHSLSGNSGDGTTAGLNNLVHENRPPYYVLAYIIKLP